MRKFLAYTILAIVFFILYGSTAISYVSPSQEINKEVILAGTIFEFILLFVSSLIIIILLYEKNVFERLLYKREKMFFAILIGFLSTIAFIIASSLILTIVGYKEENPLGEEIGENIDLKLLILIPLLSAISEETFFRGLIYAQLERKIGFIPSMLISSILFSAAHLSYKTILQVLMPFAFSIILCFLTYKTKNIFAPISAHFTNNFIALAIFLFK